MKMLRVLYDFLLLLTLEYFAYSRYLITQVASENYYHLRINIRIIILSLMRIFNKVQM